MLYSTLCMHTSHTIMCSLWSYIKDKTEILEHAKWQPSSQTFATNLHETTVYWPHWCSTSTNLDPLAEEKPCSTHNLHSNNKKNQKGICKEERIWKKTNHLKAIAWHGGFLKWWVSQQPWVFLLKNDHFGVFWGYHHLRKPPHSVTLQRLIAYTTSQHLS